MGFMQNFASSPALYLYISSDVTTSGTVSIPLLSWSTAFSVTAHDVTIVTVPASLGEVMGTENIDSKGIHIVSNDSVNVFAHNHMDYTSDASMIIPTSTLGKEYYVMAYFGTWNGSELLIVATQDSTNIDITPACLTKGGKPAGVTFSIMLMAGETYQIQSDLNTVDLTGTHIKVTNPDCKPVAVFGGGIGENFLDPTHSMADCCADHLYEENYPVVYWGKEFITVPFKNTDQNILRFLASQNNTTINVNGSAIATLNAGQYKELYNAANVKYITSNNPIAVAQYMGAGAGNNIDFAKGDPDMMMITPNSQMGNDVTFRADTFAVIDTVYVNIVADTAYLNQLTLDGISIAASFSPVAFNGSFSSASMQVTPGNHVLTTNNSANTGFAAYIYGMGWEESYSYAAVGRKAVKDTFYFSSTTPVCLGDNINFTNTNDSSSYSFLWNFGDSSTSSVQDPAHYYSSSGNYNVTLTITDIGGCSSTTITNSVTVNASSSVDAGPDTTITRGTGTVLNASGGVSCVWSPSFGLSDTASCNPVASPLSTTTYYVTIKDSNGCTNTDSVTVFVKDSVVVIKEIKCGYVFVPNVFSPNNDGENDVLYVRGNCIKEFTFTIYDRWGEKVFETSDISMGWDGTYRNKEINTSVFVYYLNATLTTGQQINQKGNVTLIK